MAENYIGIDWGQRKVGVAYGEVETGIAFALTTLEQADQIYDALAMLAREYDADAFVVGLSAAEGHSDNVDAITSFSEMLKEKTGFAVHFAHELMSTREAQQNLKQAEYKHVATKDDAEAARVILQTWMDHRDI